jgi:hypothetical protein
MIFRGPGTGSVRHDSGTLAGSGTGNNQKSGMDQFSQSI